MVIGVAMLPIPSWMPPTRTHEGLLQPVPQLRRTLQRQRPITNPPVDRGISQSHRSVPSTISPDSDPCGCNLPRQNQGFSRLRHVGEEVQILILGYLSRLLIDFQGCLLHCSFHGEHCSSL